MIFIYGPPAAGKLTVARIVGERLGYRVLHNHLTVDAVLPILPFDHPEFGSLVQRMREDLIGTAHRAGVDLVCTVVFAAGEEAMVDGLVGPYADNVTFVRLTAPPEALRARVTSDSRKAYGKIADVELLEDILERYDVYCEIGDRETVTLDTDQLSPEEAADLIVDLVA
jgi:shikimate kinase